MSESRVTLLAVAVALIAYTICAIFKKGKVGLEEVVVLAMNMVGAVTGIYIFLGSFRVVNEFQNSVWAGITGVCMMIYFLQKIGIAYVELFSREIQRQEPPSGQTPPVSPTKLGS